MADLSFVVVIITPLAQTILSLMLFPERSYISPISNDDPASIYTVNVEQYGGFP